MNGHIAKLAGVASVCFLGLYCTAGAAYIEMVICNVCQMIHQIYTNLYKLTRAVDSMIP
jgi:hypothetical protein